MRRIRLYVVDVSVTTRRKWDICDARLYLGVTAAIMFEIGATSDL